MPATERVTKAETGRPDGGWDSAAAAARDWEAGWEAQRRAAPARADNIRVDKVFSGRHLRLYEWLAEAESAALCQARTEKIGLRALLLRRGVPGIVAPTSPCGHGDQAAAHVFVECADIRSREMRGMGFPTKEEVREGLSNYKLAPATARALIRSGWLQQSRVFEELRQQDESAAGRESAWARRRRRGTVCSDSPSGSVRLLQGFLSGTGTVSLVDSTELRHRMLLLKQAAVASMTIQGRKQTKRKTTLLGVMRPWAYTIPSSFRMG